MARKTSRREFVSGLLGVTATAALPIKTKASPLPCGLRELPIGWITEYGLRHWNGNTHKEFILERARPYEWGGKQYSAEEFAQQMIAGLRKCHRKHGITVLRYYPVYAGQVRDCNEE